MAKREAEGRMFDRLARSITIKAPSPPPQMTAAEIRAAMDRLEQFRDPFLKAVEDGWRDFVIAGREFFIAERPQMPRQVGDILKPICAAIVGDPDGLPVPLPQKREPERLIPAFPAATYQSLIRGDHGR